MNTLKIGINFNLDELYNYKSNDYNIEMVFINDITAKVINNLDLFIFNEEFNLPIELKYFFDYFAIDYLKVCKFNDSNIYIFDDEYTFNNLNDCFEKITMSNNKERKQNLYFMLSTLNELIEDKEKGSFCHGLRVSYLSKKFAEELNLESKMIENIYLGALLHDIGKITVPEEILCKPGKLTDLEYEKIKKHTEMVRNLLPYEKYNDVKNIIIHHHERLDGSGYPDGLKFADIPLEVKIVSIIDSYDAMTNQRIYNEIKNKEDALNELISCSMSVENGGKGMYYDQLLVEKFESFISKM